MTVYHYNPGGYRNPKTRCRMAISRPEYGHDALDRVVMTTFPADPTENVVYSYDQTGTALNSFGIGRLTSVTDAAGTLSSRHYDERGNLAY